MSFAKSLLSCAALFFGCIVYAQSPENRAALSAAQSASSQSASSQSADQKSASLQSVTTPGACAPAAVDNLPLEASITINSKVQFQHVTGFGGFSPSPTWQYWLSNTQMEKLFGTADDQLGLNVLRLYMANSKNAWSSGLANAKIAKKYGAFIFASPWSPPAQWKSNNSDSGGGELLESHYADWANFLNDYYKYMKQQGVEIDAVSVQNEPDWRADYQSCIWTGDQMAKFLAEQGHRIQCKVIAPEAIHFSRNMHEPILNDPEACERLDIMGGHFYGWDGSSYPLAAQKGKEVWMTEYLINERQQNQGLDINWRDDGFLFARSINDAMLANMSAWVHYSLKRYYGCLGDGTYGTVNNEITKRGYILSHYAKYVSGTRRVRHSIDDSALSASAYLSASGDSIVLMVLNPNDEARLTHITLPFYTRDARLILTDESQNMAKSDISFDEETFMPEVMVEPWSVSTFIFTKSSDRDDDTPGMSDDDTLVFTDDFDLYGASCVPDGWRTKSEEGTRYAGTYSLGPRIMAFSPEGLMSHAFYFRTDSRALGYIAYGLESDFRLPLDPGKYTLSFSTVGWKSCPEITVAVQKTSNKTIAKSTVTPDVAVSDNGPSTSITATTDASLDFEIVDAANYVLRWQVPASSGGMNEALVGNIRLVKHEDTGIEGVIVDPASSDTRIFDLMGRPVTAPSAPGIYIQNGHKYIIN